MNKPAYSLRPVTNEDLDFLYQVYSSTRLEEMALTGWSPEQVESFLQMQFQAQHQYYTQNYPEAQFSIILDNEQQAGRLYLHSGPSETRIIDIALLSPFRQRGLGSAILLDILKNEQVAGRKVTIHVERNNPALSLYERLGFSVVEDKGVYFFLEWRPNREYRHQQEPLLRRNVDE